MSERANDWADKLAAEIIAEYRKYGDQPGFPMMLAGRLRLVKEQGCLDGIKDARRAQSGWLKLVSP